MDGLQKLKAIFVSPAVKAIFRWSKCVRKSVVVICIFYGLVTLCSLAETLATKELIDRAVAGEENALWIWGGVVIALTLLILGIDYATVLIKLNATTLFQRSMQSTMVTDVLSRDYAGLKKYHSGELVNRFFSDVGEIRGGVMGLLPSLVSTFISFFGAAAILISMDWRFVPLLFLGGLLGLGLMLAFRKPFKERHKRMQAAEDALHSSVQEALENIRLIKASVSESRFVRFIGRRQDHLRSEQVRQGRFSATMNSGMSLVFNVSWLFCMIWGCFNISRGLLTYGALAAIIRLIGRIQGPISNAVNIATQAYGVVASAERLQELIGMPPEEEGEALSGFDEITLSDVTFRYELERENVLDHVNCTFRKGSFTALTGVSGGGKTSLFHLLLGIYKPTEGQILFRSGAKEAVASRGTRALFAYVPQGNTLFSGTLRDNLTLFTDEASDEEIWKAVQVACIDDLVKEIGLNASLGERGVGLSEGQAQRVAIARALLTKAPVLLLDESTSALDEKTEAKVLENISTLRDKTCIIVTHRRAALAICDRVLRVAQGKITEKREGDTV